MADNTHKLAARKALKSLRADAQLIAGDNASDERLIHKLKNELDTLIDTLAEMLGADESLAFVAYKTSCVLAIDEQEVLANGQREIVVTKLSEWHHLWTVLNYYKQFYVPDECSTRFVSRMPGIIVTRLPATIVINVIDKINFKKDIIQALVQDGRNHQQRHEFIHDMFPQVMTEQLYRHIRYTLLPINRVWFRWESRRQVNKTYTNDDAIQWLAEQEKKPKGLYAPDEWIAHVKAAAALIKKSEFKHVQRQREYRVLPSCDYNYYLGDKPERTRKNGKFNATTPWILFNQPENRLPGGTPLTTYVSTEKLDNKKQTANTQSIFMPLKLIGVAK